MYCAHSGHLNVILRQHDTQDNRFRLWYYYSTNNNHNNEYLDKLEHLTCTGPLEVLIVFTQHERTHARTHTHAHTHTQTHGPTHAGAY